MAPKKDMCPPKTFKKNFKKGMKNNLRQDKAVEFHMQSTRTFQLNVQQTVSPIFAVAGSRNFGEGGQKT